MKRACAVAAVAVLAGCGGGGATHRGRTVTLPGYAGVPATTIVGTYSASACAADSRAFAREAVLFANHSGPSAAYGSDTYYIDLRRIYGDFEARDCDVTTLGDALSRRLTAKQQRLLVDNLPADMAQTVAKSIVRR